MIILKILGFLFLGAVIAALIIGYLGWKNDPYILMNKTIKWRPKA